MIMTTQFWPSITQYLMIIKWEWIYKKCRLYIIVFFFENIYIFLGWGGELHNQILSGAPEFLGTTLHTHTLKCRYKHTHTHTHMQIQTHTHRHTLILWQPRAVVLRRTAPAAWTAPSPRTGSPREMCPVQRGCARSRTKQSRGIMGIGITWRKETAEGPGTHQTGEAELETIQWSRGLSGRSRER